MAVFVKTHSTVW